MNKKMIVWDFGNVIASFSADAFFENLAELFDVAPRDVISFLEGSIEEEGGAKPLWHAIEAGRHWSPERIYGAFAQRFDAEPDRGQFFHAFNGPLSDDNGHGKRFVAFSKRISAREYHQGLISNANAIHASRMEHELGYLLSYIPREHRHYSWELSCRKGEGMGIFHKVFGVFEHLLGIERENIVFIDDRHENVEECILSGAKAIEFNIGDGIYRLEERLRGMGFPV